MSWVYWSSRVHFTSIWITTFFFGIFWPFKNCSNGLISEIVFLLSHSYSMSWWREVIGLAKLSKINLVSWFLPHDHSVMISDFVVVSYGIRRWTVVVSWFWETEDFAITIINCFSSLMLQSTNVFILSMFPVISHQVHRLFGFVIEWLRECMRWINNTMFHIEWLHFVSIVRGVRLQGISECGSVHVFTSSWVFGNTKWMKWR